MNYTKIYVSLIMKRTKNHIIDESNTSCELHHIVPKSEGGTNDKSNLVRLTIKEHIFAHQLLARIYNDKQMWLSAHLLMKTKDVPNNKCLRLAETARIKMSEFLRGKNNPLYGKGMFGEDNPFYGKHHSEEMKRHLSMMKKGKPSSFRGRHHSDETKKILSQLKLGKPNYSRRGKRYSEKEKDMMVALQKTCKKVIQIDDVGNIINVYRSIRDAERKTNINRRCIKWCLHGKQKHAGGFVWKFDIEDVK